MDIVQLGGAYRPRPVEVYWYAPERYTPAVTIICNELFGVFDPAYACGVRTLGGLLIERSVSHVVFYNSSRAFSFPPRSSFETRAAAFAGKTFDEELNDLCAVIRYVKDRAQGSFNINPLELALYVHGMSIGGTVALMASAKFPEIQRLSLCAPPSNRGRSKQSVISTMSDSEAIFAAASRFVGELFLLYGDEDTVVPRESSFAICTHARKAQVSTRVIPGADHDFRRLYGIKTPKAHEVFADAIYDFFSGNH